MEGYYDGQLKVLHERMLRKQHLDHVLEDLYMQRQQISVKVNEYKETELAAMTEIQRLEKGGLAGLIAGFGGKKEEKIEAAKKRALAAKLKVEAMDAAMDAIYNESMKCREEMKGMDDCIKEYQQMYEAKKEAIKNSGSEEGDRLIELELTLSELEAKKKEMKEAEEAGSTARATADRIVENLESADSWATWDMFGGGIFTDVMKYDKLDVVQREVELLQGQLQTFRAELIDVKFSMDLNFAIDGFTRFADWFFDGIFVDWTVKEEIGRAKGEAEHFITQVDKVQKKLAEHQKENELQMEECKKEIDALIQRVPM